MTAAIFCLRTLGAGEIVGAGLICPAARYVSVRWIGADRLDRRFATPAQWRALENDLRGLSARPLEADSAASRLLVGDRAVTVTYTSVEEFQPAAPTDCVKVLDRRLLAQPFDAVRFQPAAGSEQ